MIYFGYVAGFLRSLSFYGADYLGVYERAICYWFD